MLIKIIGSAGFVAITSLGIAIAVPAQAQQPTFDRQFANPNLIASECECARYRACQIRSRALTAVPIVATPAATAPITPPPATEIPAETIAPPAEPTFTLVRKFPAPRARG
jgi:hypothetical protein